MASAQVGKRIKQYKTMPVGPKKDAMRKRINTGVDWLGKKARGEV